MRLAPLRIHRWLPVADVLSHVLVELIDVPGRDHADVFRSCPDGYARGGLVSQAATPEDYGPVVSGSTITAWAPRTMPSART